VLGISESCLRNWVAQADVDDGVKPGLSSDERAELAALRRDKRRLELENEMLKRAIVGGPLSKRMERYRDACGACSVICRTVRSPPFRQDPSPSHGTLEYEQSTNRSSTLGTRTAQHPVRIP
jgi:hypothetical protein